MTHLLSVLSIGLLIHGMTALDTSVFVQEEMCNVEESISTGCSKKVSGVRSRLECVVLCWRNTECVGASMDAQGVCLHHQICHTSVPCPDASSPTHRYMEPYCLHGTWNSDTKSCTCLYGTFGERCNRYYSSCVGLLQAGFPNGGYLVIIDPLHDGTSLTKVKIIISQPLYCNVNVFVNSGKINFNRTWAEYRNGFRDADDIEDFWIGLRPWYYLTKFELKKLVTIVYFKSGGKVFNSYRGYEMTADGDKYFLKGDLSWKSSSGPSVPAGTYAGDCLTPLQGLAFSTWDRDHTGNIRGENCASQAGYGWWHNASCDSPCQMLGWGLDDYQATPPAQRLTFLVVNVARDFALIDKIQVHIEKA